MTEMVTINQVVLDMWQLLTIFGVNTGAVVLVGMFAANLKGRVQQLEKDHAYLRTRQERCETDNSGTSRTLATILERVDAFNASMQQLHRSFEDHRSRHEKGQP